MDCTQTLWIYRKQTRGYWSLPLKDVPIKSVSMSPSIFLSSAAKIFQRTFGFPKVRAEDAAMRWVVLEWWSFGYTLFIYLKKTCVQRQLVLHLQHHQSISGKIQFTPLDGGAAVVKRKEKDACESIKAWMHCNSILGPFSEVDIYVVSSIHWSWWLWLHQRRRRILSIFHTYGPSSSDSALCS